jgi:hypothetical protein
MQPDTRYAKSGEVNIAYQAFGEGPINLVFAPPFVSNIENYWNAPDLLAGCFVWEATRAWLCLTSAGPECRIVLLNFPVWSSAWMTSEQ